ncbi:hypothetical protein WCE39_13380 [Luteimonas sp. MJ174]
MRGPALPAKLVQRPGRTHFSELQFHALRGEHGKELARTELGQPPAFEAG